MNTETVTALLDAYEQDNNYPKLKSGILGLLVCEKSESDAPKKYRLIKDLPQLKVSDNLIFEERGDIWENGRRLYTANVKKGHHRLGFGIYTFDETYINSEWFEEVKEGVTDGELQKVESILDENKRLKEEVAYLKKETDEELSYRIYKLKMEEMDSVDKEIHEYIGRGETIPYSIVIKKINYLNYQVLLLISQLKNV